MMSSHSLAGDRRVAPTESQNEKTTILNKSIIWRTEGFN